MCIELDLLRAWCKCSWSGWIGGGSEVSHEITGSILTEQLPFWLISFSLARKNFNFLAMTSYGTSTMTNGICLPIWGVISLACREFATCITLEFIAINNNKSLHQHWCMMKTVCSSIEIDKKWEITPKKHCIWYKNTHDKNVCVMYGKDV